MPVQIFDADCSHTGDFAPIVPAGSAVESFVIMWGSETVVSCCQSFAYVGNSQLGKFVEPCASNPSNIVEPVLPGVGTVPDIFIGSTVHYVLCHVCTAARFTVWIFPHVVATTTNVVSTGVSFRGNIASVSGGAFYADTDFDTVVHHVIFHPG